MRREEKRRREKLKVHICKYIEVESSSNNKQKITFESYLYSALTSLKPGNNIVREESDGRSIKRRTVPGEKREEERREKKREEERRRKKKKEEERRREKREQHKNQKRRERMMKKKKYKKKKILSQRSHVPVSASFVVAPVVLEQSPW